jgi:DNA-binding response OmpR family regulator
VHANTGWRWAKAESKETGRAVGDLSVAVVIEDDLDLRNLVEGVLLQSGFIVHTAEDGRHGVEMVREKCPDVLTLDVALPDIDGFEVLRRVRQFSNAYVVMLTGRTEESDLLAALQGGADDYITKPFRPREMRARVAAMMRRPRHPNANPGESLQPPPVPLAATGGPVLRHDGLTLNPTTRTAMLSEAPLALTRSEFDLLHELLLASGTVLSRAELVRAIRGNHYPKDAFISEADKRTVEVHIGNLRRKLQDDPELPCWLQTVRGIGYRLAAGRSPDEPV